MKQVQCTKEDLEFLLANLEQMFVCERRCLSETAMNALLVSIGLEAQLLAMKLEVMAARWQNYIPLRELVGFDYETWITKLGQWIEIIEDDYKEGMPKEYKYFIPSSQYLFDYYGVVQDETEGRELPFYVIHPEKEVKEDTKQFVQTVGHMIKYRKINDDLLWLKNPCCKTADRLAAELIAQYDDIHDGKQMDMDAVHLRISMLFASIKNEEDGIRCCLMALGNLLMSMKQLQGLTTGTLQPQVFQRLSIRQYYHLCTDAHRKAINQVNEWKSTWPDRKMKEYATAKKEVAKKTLKDMKFGDDLAVYINLDSPSFINSVEFGKFLYKNRMELTRENISDIHYQCRLITQLNTLIDEPAPNPQSAPVRELKGREKEIWVKIRTLINMPRASWTNITPVEVERIMTMALNVRGTLKEAKYIAMSERLWELFKYRSRCNEERSLMVTWLNIAGFFRLKGYLSSKDPGICAEFFPNQKGTTYNNVTKGREGTQKNFQEVVELLEYSCNIIKP